MRRTLNEEGYPLSNTQNDQLNNFGYTYELLPLHNNLGQKGNDKEAEEKTNLTFKQSDFVSGYSQEDKKRHIGQILSIQCNSNAQPILAQVIDAKSRKVYMLDYDSLETENNIYEMNNKIYNKIMRNISRELKSELCEAVRSNGGVRKPLSRQAQVTNIEMEQPIFGNPTYTNWYQNFICLGGGCYIKKIQGMDCHTFICNTQEAAKSLYSMLKKNFVDRKVYVEGERQYDEIMALPFAE